MARNDPEPLIGGRAWAELWPDVERHLYRVLRFRVPPGVECADVIQETAARLFARGSSFATDVEVFRFSTRIAVNLAIDLTRRSALVAWQPLLRDVPSSQDVESEVLSRAELAELCRDVAAGRIDLTGLAADPEDETPASSALKSRRYRVRKRLVRWSDRLAGGLLVPRLRWALGGLATTAALAPAFVPGGLHPTYQSPAERIEQPHPSAQAPVGRLTWWMNAASSSPTRLESMGPTTAAHPRRPAPFTGHKSRSAARVGRAPTPEHGNIPRTRLLSTSSA